MSHSRRPTIDVIGSLNIDLVTTTPRVPAGGETLTAKSFATHPGGKGANQAVACARASRNRANMDAAVDHSADSRDVTVSMFGAIGDDAYGELLLKTLAADGIQSRGVVKAESTTGVAVILVEEDSGENRILLSTGANGSVHPDRLPSLSSREKPDLIVMQLEIPHGTVLHVIQEAKEHNVDVLLNPAPAVKLPDEAFDGLAHLVLNETEAAIMCDLGAPSSDSELESFLDQAFARLASKGVRHIVITLGSKGVAYATSAAGSKIEWKRAHACKVDKVVDTTAAGDTFVGYYAVGLVLEKEQSSPPQDYLERIVARANAAAALTVTKQGAMESIPYRDELL